MLGLHCYVWAFFTYEEWRLLFITKHRLLTVTSLVRWLQNSGLVVAAHWL